MKWLKTKQVRNRFLYTLLLLIVFEIGTYITLPGIGLSKIEGTTALYNLMNLSSGGSISRFGLLALGASPYITATIIVQLLAKGILPYYKNLSEQGRMGQVRLAQHTRIFTLVFGWFTALSILFSNTVSTAVGIVITADTTTKFLLSFILAFGGLFVSYIGELIDEKGIGNGQSNIIAFGILTTLPAQFYNVFTQKDFYTSDMSPYLISVGVLAVVYIVVSIIAVFSNNKEYKLPLQAKNYNVDIKAHYLPIKLLASSVMPIIFASSVFTIISVIGTVTQNVWNFADYTTWSGLALYSVLIFIFSYMYNLIQVDGEQISKNLKEGSMYIKGVSNENTESYLNKRVVKITNIGAPILTIIASASLLAELLLPVKFGLALTGVSILILVGVIQDMIHQIKGLTSKNNYKEIIE